MKTKERKRRRILTLDDVAEWISKKRIELEREIDRDGDYRECQAQIDLLEELESQILHG